MTFLSKSRFSAKRVITSPYSSDKERFFPIISVPLFFNIGEKKINNNERECSITNFQRLWFQISIIKVFCNYFFCLLNWKRMLDIYDSCRAWKTESKNCNLKSRYQMIYHCKRAIGYYIYKMLQWWTNCNDWR